MLQSLERASGLPIAFDPVSAAIRWPEGIDVEKTSVRTAAEMREYLREPEARPTREAIYTVYRDVGRRADREAIASAGLRFDLTVIPPGHFAGSRREFFRTAGHYHVLPPPRRVPYPEVYEVVSGRALWLIQRPEGADPARLREIYLVSADPGEKALIPPGFGHISINAEAEALVMANWIAASTVYDYDPYRRLGGGGYLLLEGEVPDTVELAKNPAYQNVPELVKLRPREIPALGLLRSRPLYTLISQPAQLAFLTRPEEFADVLAIDTCYRKAV